MVSVRTNPSMVSCSFMLLRAMSSAILKNLSLSRSLSSRIVTLRFLADLSALFALPIATSSALSAIAHAPLPLARCSVPQVETREVKVVEGTVEETREVKVVEGTVEEIRVVKVVEGTVEEIRVVKVVDSALDTVVEGGAVETGEVSSSKIPSSLMLGKQWTSRVPSTVSISS